MAAEAAAGRGDTCQSEQPYRHLVTCGGPRARPLLAALVFGLALAVTPCGSGTPIGGTASPHATPTQTPTPTPIPSPATTWRIIPSPNPPSPPTSGLVAVSALTPADAWAVGGTYTGCCRWRPLIEHWDGATWHIVSSPGTTSLQGVAALSPRDVWAVGSGLETYAPVNGPTLIEHWNGTQWSIVPSPNPSANDNSLASVAALAPNDVWAVGTIAAPLAHRAASTCR